ncbi:MAG: hypothetical protein ACK4GT_00270 [Pararhodobacter sp.]
MKKLCAAIILAAVFCGPGQAESLGRWCSQPEGTFFGMDAAIRIDVAGQGRAIASYEFPTSTTERELRMVGRTLFDVEDDVDGYRILDTGDLELFDDMGVIRTAFRMDKGTPAEECWR